MLAEADAAGFTYDELMTALAEHAGATRRALPPTIEESE